MFTQKVLLDYSWLLRMSLCYTLSLSLRVASVVANSSHNSQTNLRYVDEYESGISVKLYQKP